MFCRCSVPTARTRDPRFPPGGGEFLAEGGDLRPEGFGVVPLFRFGLGRADEIGRDRGGDVAEDADGEDPHQDRQHSRVKKTSASPSPC